MKSTTWQLRVAALVLPLLFTLASGTTPAEWQQLGFSSPRADFRCGSAAVHYAACDPWSARPCCSRSGYCGTGQRYCSGPRSHDFRDLTKKREAWPTPSPTTTPKQAVRTAAAFTVSTVVVVCFVALLFCITVVLFFTVCVPLRKKRRFKRLPSTHELEVVAMDEDREEAAAPSVTSWEDDENAAFARAQRAWGGIVANEAAVESGEVAPSDGSRAAVASWNTLGRL